METSWEWYHGDVVPAASDAEVDDMHIVVDAVPLCGGGGRRLVINSVVIPPSHPPLSSD